jgi:hypothetical protein
MTVNFKWQLDCSLNAQLTVKGEMTWKYHGQKALQGDWRSWCALLACHQQHQMSEETNKACLSSYKLTMHTTTKTII